MTFRLRYVTAILATLVATAPGAVRAQQIWLAPQPRSVDIVDMFRPGAAWASSASVVNVFKFYGNPYIVPTPREKIEAIVAGLKQRNIAIAVEAGMMNPPDGPHPACGGWGLVEGYGPVHMHETIARKIKRSGGTISYIAMDEPLWYGHYFRRRQGQQPGCQMPIDQVVRLLVPSLQVYLREFPDVIIGDIEPSKIADVSPGTDRSPDWQHDLETFARSFHDALGRNLAFVHIDVGWTQRDSVPHTETLYRGLVSLKQQHLIDATGLIYNGAADQKSNALWVKSAREHIDLLEGRMGLHPDQVVIQSWNRVPTVNLPENAQDSLTSVLKYYRDRKR